MMKNAAMQGSVSSRPSTTARFCAMLAPFSSLRASLADISGSSTVPIATPTTPIGSWLMRSA